MNLYETNYLLDNGISMTDFQVILKSIGISKYSKLNTNYKSFGVKQKLWYKILKKFKDADLVKEVKGELRLNPYFYLQPNLETSVIRKLQDDWDNPEPKHHVGDEFITNPITGEVYKVWLEKQKVRFREANVEDYNYV